MRMVPTAFALTQLTTETVFANCCCRKRVKLADRPDASPEPRLFDADYPRRRGPLSWCAARVAVA